MVRVNDTRRLLVIDDNISFREGLCEGLERRGYLTVAAADGLEALSRIISEPFDLLISDVNMPRLDGLGLIEELQKLLAGHRPPCVLMTAKYDERLVSLAMELRVDKVIAKPFRLGTMIEAVQEILVSR